MRLHIQNNGGVIMNAEIIAVGSELLLGQITNTNAKYISTELARIGINVYFHTVVGDNEKRLESAIQIAQSRANLIIFTGGLGPTKDDLTKETIANSLGLKLIFHEEALQSIQSYFERTNREMTENNKKQALVLENSIVLRNETGMAPGMVIEKDGMIYVLLPGPPHEMEPMFSKYGVPSLMKLMDAEEVIQSRVIHFFNIGEATLETKLQDLIDSQTNPTIAPLASLGEVKIRLTAKHQSKEVANRLLKETEKEILSRVGDYVYGYDDTTLFLELAKMVKKHGYTLASAESLTGGMFQQELTAISGASDWFNGGIVCYTNDVKEKLLHVSRETLQNEGAVSEQCAIELAENVRKLINSTIGISFTGVAGPSDSEGKQPGTVFIGISIQGQETKTYRLNLSGDRQSIRIRSAKYGAWFLLRELSKLKE